MTDNSFVVLRNTVSGVAQEYTKAEAEKWLSHPTLGKVLEVVRTDKPEVLAHPAADDELDFNDEQDDKSAPKENKK